MSTNDEVNCLIKTILFDLDGTLLPIDTDAFARQYMRALGAYAGHLVPPVELVKQVWAATGEMIRNTDPGLTNAEVFANAFFPRVGVDRKTLMPVFDAFYREQFPSLRSTCTGLPGVARSVVETALEQGYEIVLATNPLFPRVAIEERMRWIEVDDLPWRLVTVYEEMHACKPQLRYYEEVLERIGRAPGECLMVGNDVQEDGAAASLGIDVFFVTDFLIDREGRVLPPERSGTLASLRDLLAAGL